MAFEHLTQIHFYHTIKTNLLTEIRLLVSSPVYTYDLFQKLFINTYTIIIVRVTIFFFYITYIYINHYIVFILNDIYS